jgi:hypothetical protein
LRKSTKFFIFGKIYFFQASNRSRSIGNLRWTLIAYSRPDHSKAVEFFHFWEKYLAKEKKYTNKVEAFVNFRVSACRAAGGWF